MINRSSMPRLLRKSGGSTEKLPEGASSPLLAKGNKTGLTKPNKMTMTDMVKKISGSQTHSNLTTEPSIKALRAPKRQVTDALPKRGAGFGIKRAAGGTAQESYVNKGARPDGEVDSCTPIQSAKGGKWIQNAIKKPGALHKSLGVSMGKKIPEAKIVKAEHSRNPTLKKRAVLAHTLSGLRRGR